MSEVKYHIVSLKHTQRGDKFLTLWRPDEKGYCYAIRNAGEYSEYRNDHDGSYAIPIGFLVSSEKSFNDDGLLCYKNTSSIVKRIKEFQP